MEALVKKFTATKNFRLLRSQIGRRKQAKAGGLYGSSKAVFLQALASEAPVLAIAAHLDDADRLYQEISSAAPESVISFPAWESLPDKDAHPDPEIFADRAQTIWAIKQGKARIIVATILSLLQPLPTPEKIEANVIDLGAGRETGMRTILEWAEGNELERVDTVCESGQYSVRGGIVDIFPPSVDEPLRLDFFGDTLESIRTFDLNTQRSKEEIASCKLFSPQVSEFFVPQPRPDAATLLDYLSDDTVVAFIDGVEIEKRIEQLDSMYADTNHSGAYKHFTAQCGKYALVETASLPFADPKAVGFPVRSLQRFEGKLEEVRQDFARILERSLEVVVFVLNESERTRFGELFEDEIAASGKRVRLAHGVLIDGFELRDKGIVAVAYHQLFNRYRQTRVSRKHARAMPIDDYLELRKNDYVVHMLHGIGRFAGIERMERDGLESEYIAIEYAGGAKYYEPILNIELVQKYIGVKGFVPKLDKIGTGYWSARKARVKRAVQSMAAEMLRIQAIRNSRPGIAYPPDDRWQHEFEEAFIYEATIDQLEVSEIVKQEMQRQRPMDRLICGDVGYGKTEIAMRAAFKAVLAGKQVTMLVPTTVLAQQHYNTFTERMADFPLEIGVISRFRTPAEQREILARTAEGRIDILIGTHRLVSGDVSFKNLGLLIIDEEQRFGVAHKEKLKSMRTVVDILTLTATPIPRTLHMALMGLREISSLTTAPRDRLSIETTIRCFDPRIIREAILRELSRDGQVFFVHNRVFDIIHVADRIQAIVPEARIGIAHGQMPEHLLERRMLDFVNHEFDILVCTTIIESGLDIPNVNTIFIDDAHMYGLADLHQLRGRVGRYKHRAFAYMLIPADTSLTALAEKRLRAIEEFNELGAGFKIAMRDLEIRGAGNVLGPEQSGHITAVGYDMYCRLLKGSVSELKRIEYDEPLPVSIKLGLDADIPEFYIANRESRLRVYRRISAARNRETLEDLREELRDRYGAPPPKVETLWEIGELRFTLGKLGITHVSLQNGSLVLQVKSYEKISARFKKIARRLRMVDANTITIALSPEEAVPRTIPALMRKWLKT